MELDSRIRLHLVSEFRSARTRAFEDSEAFIGIVVAAERLARELHPDPSTPGLGGQTAPIATVLEPHAAVLGAEPSSMNVKVLLDRIVRARNEAVHAGVFARALTAHCIDLALVAEDALMSGMNTVGDFMTREVIVAETWHRLADARRVMLRNSFSWLPVSHRDEWMLLADCDILSLPGIRGDKNTRGALLLRTIEDLLEEQSLELEKARTLTPNDPIRKAVQLFKSQDSKRQPSPVLVLDGGHRDRLVGILTPFDLL